MGEKGDIKDRDGRNDLSSGVSQESEFQTEIVITSVEMIGGEDDVS